MHAGSSDDLIQLHIDWLGGRKALEKLQAITASGTLQTAGLEGSLAIRETRSGWRRRETGLGPTSMVEVSGPEGGWAMSWSGQVEPMSAARLETRNHNALWDFYRPLLADVGATRQDLGQEPHAGRHWRVVRFSFSNGDVFDLFLDPQDGSSTWIRKQEDTRTFWIERSDWRVVSGVRLPFSQRTFHDNSELDATVRWTFLKVNQDLTSADFEPPQPRPRSAGIAGGEASTPWMPVDLVEGRYVFLHGRIGGREVPLLLDSGAGTTVLSADFARELGLNAAGRVFLQGSSRSQQAGLLAGITVEIGALQLSDLTVVVTDLHDVEEALGRKVPVILGKEVFNSVVVEIDYPAARLAFHDPVSYHPDPAARPLRLFPGESGDKLVEVSIEGRPPGLFVLDTGSGSTVTLFKSYIEEQGLLENRAPPSERFLRGVGGGSVVAVATLETLALAGFELRDVPADFYQEAEGAFHTRRAAGTLGAGILGRFRVVLDYSRDRLYLVPDHPIT